MGVVTPVVDPSYVVQALVYTLLDVFDETRDLHYTLRKKERKDYEQSLRTKGYPHSRRVTYVEDEDIGSDESIIMDKAAVTRQYEIGFQEAGSQFAIGDVPSHTALQGQIIALQSVLISTFLYGPTSREPIAQQLSNLNAASRAAGTSAVDILGMQLKRQKEASMRSRTPPPADDDSSTSTSVAGYEHNSRPRSGSPANTTILEWRGKPKLDRSDTDTTSITGPTSYGMKTTPHHLYCLYAIDLQRHPSQHLSKSITSDPVPTCPHCKRALHLSPGKAWEICKADRGYERTFRVSNRFVVKCHRDGADGQYSCVLCTRHASVDSVAVCGDVKALIRHIWEEHGVSELKHEEDITEIIDIPTDHRRDSAHGHSASWNSRRSASLGPSRYGRTPPFDY